MQSLWWPKTALPNCSIGNHNQICVLPVMKLNIFQETYYTYYWPLWLWSLLILMSLNSNWWHISSSSIEMKTTQFEAYFTNMERLVIITMFDPHQVQPGWTPENVYMAQVHKIGYIFKHSQNIGLLSKYKLSFTPSYIREQHMASFFVGVKFF